MNDETVVCLVLAAGAGSRFHDSRHKLLAELPASSDRPAESVSSRAVAGAVAAGIGEVIVVTGRLGAGDFDFPVAGSTATTEAGPTATTGAVTRAVTTGAVRTIVNPRWADGQMTSVHAGLDAARDAGASIAVIGLADQPGVSADAWRSVAAVACDGAAIAVATYDGRRGNPVALRRAVWDLLASAGDEGARTLMRVRPDLVVEVPCTGSPTDIDTVEDLRRWQNSSSTNSP